MTRLNGSNWINWVAYALSVFASVVGVLALGFSGADITFLEVSLSLSLSIVLVLISVLNTTPDVVLEVEVSNPLVLRIPHSSPLFVDYNDSRWPPDVATRRAGRGYRSSKWTVSRNLCPLPLGAGNLVSEEHSSSQRCKMSCGIGLQQRFASESGRLRQPTEGHSRGDRRRSVLMLPTLQPQTACRRTQ